MDINPMSIFLIALILVISYLIISQTTKSGVIYFIVSYLAVWSLVLVYQGIDINILILDYIMMGLTEISIFIGLGLFRINHRRLYPHA